MFPPASVPSFASLCIDNIQPRAFAKVKTSFIAAFAGTQCNGFTASQVGFIPATSTTGWQPTCISNLACTNLNCACTGFTSDQVRQAL